MADKSGFSFKVLFLDDDGFIIDTDHFDILVNVTCDPEDDRDEAYGQALDHGGDLLDNFGADDFEISLVNAY